MTTLADYWHPIAAAGDVVEQPRRFVLLGEPLVAFRDEAGVAVFKDLCIHRGTALSLGWITDGRLTCAYHGWQYDRTGACVRIPSLPEGAPIPPKARAIVHHAAEAYGLVWACLGEPAAPIPPYPDGEYGDPSYRHHLSSHNVWRSSAGRATENFMDYSHFPFVHPNLLAPPDRTLVEPVEVVPTDEGFTYVHEIEQEGPGLEGERVRLEYFYYRPFTIHLRIVTSGGVQYYTQFAAPTAADRTDLFIVILRNYDQDTPDAVFDEYNNRILEQDRRIVESQRPEAIPLDLRDELHLKFPDASGIALRRTLAAIAQADDYLP